MSTACDYCLEVIRGKEADVKDPLVVLYGLTQDTIYEHLCTECQNKIKALMLSTEPRAFSVQDILQVSSLTDWKVKNTSDEVLFDSKSWLTVNFSIKDLLKVLRAEVVDVHADGNELYVVAKSTGIKKLTGNQ